MIFDTPNRDFDTVLNEVEFTLWQSIWGKPEGENWDETIKIYEDFGCQHFYLISGLIVGRLQSYQNTEVGKSQLDEDCRRLLPILDDDKDNSVLTSYLSDTMSSADLSSHEDDDGDDDISDAGNIEDAATGGAADDKTDDVEEILHSNLNARKL